jgi:hypothetical protein
MTQHQQQHWRRLWPPCSKQRGRSSRRQQQGSSGGGLNKEVQSPLRKRGRGAPASKAREAGAAAVQEEEEEQCVEQYKALELEVWQQYKQQQQQQDVQLLRGVSGRPGV